MNFSIILPHRNGNPYVRECVDSILSQSLKDFDLLVLDNDSKDGSLEWLRSLGDPRIKIFPSGGPLSMEANWARILALPKNEFMTIIGHDDILEPDYLAIMKNLINEHPGATLYQTHFRYIDRHGNFVRFARHMDKVQDAAGFLACHVFQSLDSMGTGYLFRSRDYDALGGIPVSYPNLMFADYELWTRLTALAYKATDLRIGFSYRLHDSTSRVTNGEKYKEAFLRYTEFLSRFLLSDQSARTVFQRHGHIFMDYYCQALAHRLLKTKRSDRATSVDAFIRDCSVAAGKLGCEQGFDPYSRPAVRIASLLDKTFLGRSIFLLFQRLKKWK